jgi:DNA repair protein RadC
VLDAPIKELEKIEGIGHNAGVFLKLIREVERYYHISKNNNELRERKLNSRDDCGKYMSHYFDGSKVEKVYLLCLDGKNKVLSCRQVNEGSVNCTEISTRKIVDIALTENATSVVLAHNHPSGLALPSALDVQTTLRVIQALQHVDVMMVDHVIITDDDRISLVDSKFIDESYCTDVFGVYR